MVQAARCLESVVIGPPRACHRSNGDRHAANSDEEVDGHEQQLAGGGL
jgi:hypothetical protein